MSPTTTMRAVRIVSWGGGPQVVDVPVPEPGPGQVRVRVGGCGLCHSDLAMSDLTSDLGTALGWELPFTLGHETAGWVDAWGDGVTGYTEGDPVAVAAPASCGACRWCRRGQEAACPSGDAGRGYGRDGGLAEFVLVDDPRRALVPLGPLDPTTAGPLTDAAATSHHAVARVAPRVGDDSAVVVIGAGGLGGFVVQLMQHLTGARLVVIEPDEARRASAVDLGADAAVERTESVGEAIGDLPVDAVIDLVGTDDTIAAAASLLAPAGALALVGANGGRLRRPWFGTLPRDAEVFTFQGSDRADLDAVVALAAAGHLRLDVTAFPLDRALDAYQALREGTLVGRAVVQPERR